MKLRVSEKKVQAGRRKAVTKAGRFIHKNAAVLSLALAGAFLIGTMAFAENLNAEEMWNSIMGVMMTWILRLGGLVVIVGGIMLGLGFRSEDAEQKTRGTSTIIAGAIVMVVAGLVNLILF